MFYAQSGVHHHSRSCTDADLDACLPAPAARYKVGKQPEPGDPAGQQSRSQLTQRIAAKLSAKFMELQRSGKLPARESCDLLVLDRCGAAAA